MIEKELSRIEGILSAREKATTGEWIFKQHEGVKVKDADISTEHTHGTRSWTEWVARAEYAHEFAFGSDAAKNMQFIALAANEIESLCRNYRKALEALQKISENKTLCVFGTPDMADSIVGAFQQGSNIAFGQSAEVADETLRDICGECGE